MIDEVRQYFLSLQDSICQELGKIDGRAEFQRDEWSKTDGQGGGITAILRDGAVFEQAGVNFSWVKGANLPQSATAERPDLVGRSFTALGVSLVVHPHNPYAPTSHANIRFFVAEKENDEAIWWFGGGFDLTPFYGFDEDCRHWHTVAKSACKPFGDGIYAKYKKRCDDYFYLKHRDEQRGIGGLFFDDLNEGGFEHCFAFTKSVGDHYLPAYTPIIKRRLGTKFTTQNRQFQLYRRGRYVEFNLLYDRGTLFGLQTGGRVESILMSLPPKVRWEYKFEPKTGSKEERLTKYFLKPQNWLK